MVTPQRNREFAGPHPAAEHDEPGAYRPLVHLHAGGTTVPALDVKDPNTLDEFRAARLRAFRQSERDLFGNHISVVRQPRRAQEIVDTQQGPFGLCLLRADHLHLDTEPFAQGFCAAKLDHEILGFRDDQAANLFPADGMAGFLFEPGVKLGAAFVDLGEAV
jgi:hypothetical protein